MGQAKRHLITSALPYANGPLHIGHIAGAYLPADIYVRYLRMKGEDVVFVCGSDEHGAAITLRAKKEGVSPKEIIDKYHGINKKAFEDFGIDFDIYHRTSEALHHETAQEFFKNLDEKGQFTKEITEQYFDEEHQQFLADRYITGTCPNCSYEKAYGDQCENCGTSLSPKQLIDPKSTLSGNTPKLRETWHYYLPMQNHSDWLRTWIKEGKLEGEQHHDPAAWRNQVLGQCLSWIDGGDGLQPRAMTRDLDWGVKVPVEGADGKVLYVWLDAPIGYISATRQWAKDNGKDWKDYWQSEDSSLVHFIGKDNIVFHCIIFPIILKAHGKFNLPVNVPANEFLNLEGDKISTSRNHAVWLHEYLEDFPERKDELRYVLCSIAPEAKDSEFIWNDYMARVNNELVAILGNFVNRSVVLTHKYYQGVVPKVAGEGLMDTDRETLTAIKTISEKVAKKINRFKFREGLIEAMNLARTGNKYLADNEPWKLVKTDPERVQTIMHVALQVTAALGVIMEPFLPDTSAKIRGFAGIDSCDWEMLSQENLLPAGTTLQKAGLLFQKLEQKEMDQQMEKLEASKAANQAQAGNHEPVKENITFDDFTKMDIRVGTIEAAERVPKTDKLLKLTVNTGVDRRTVVSGIAGHYDPEQIVGQQVSILLNLQPRKIRGVESQGMILMAENSAGKLSFVSPIEDDIDPGSEIR